MTVVTINPGDSPDIAAAINAALADPSVTQVILGAGEFLVHSSIIIPSGKSLVGAGRDLTALKAAPDFDRSPGMLGVVNTERGADGVTISDLSVDVNRVTGSGDRLHGTYLHEATDFAITRVDVYNATGYGHHAQGDADSFTVYASGTYDDCATYNCQIGFEQMACDGIVLTNCHARDGDGDLVGTYFHPLTGSKNITYIGCTGYGYAFVGMEMTANLRSLENIRIIDCDIELLRPNTALYAGGGLAHIGLEIIGSRFVSNGGLGAILQGVSGTAIDTYFQGEAVGVIFYNALDGTEPDFVATNSHTLGLRDPTTMSAAYGIGAAGGLVIWDGGTIEARGRPSLMFPIGSTAVEITAATTLVKTGFGAIANYTEDSPGAVIAPGLTLPNVALGSLDGGSVLIGFQAMGTVHDQLAILDQGSGAGQIGVNGTQVSFGGTVIGTFSGGTNGADLVISLGAGATPAAVEALVRAITFSNDSDAPAKASRAVEYVVTDAAGAVAKASAAVTVTQVNDAPLLDMDGPGPGATLAYLENQAGTPIAPSAELVDPDEKFNGGSLKIGFSAGGTVDDRLSIRFEGNGEGQIGLAGKVVSYGGMAIGTVTGGGVLIINFNANASPEAVEALVRRIGYYNVSDAPVEGTRTVTFTVNDGAGGSVQANATIFVTSVDDLASAKADHFATSENVAITTASVFANNGGGVDSDVDGPALQVSKVNGSASDVGQEIILPSGAKLILSADGTFRYDPNGAFNTLVAPGSVAVNTSDTDSFTYTLANGNSATVTVLVNGVTSTDDVYEGDGGNNVIIGNSADNIMNGGIGADTMTGGTGNDTYYYDHINDRAYDSSAANGGIDTIFSSVTATLSTWIENLTLTGTGDLTGVGNALDNVITGNSGNNLLSGAAGADTMYGGLGNDTFIFDNAGDRAFDESGASGGIDTVQSSVSATLSAWVENLILTGTAKIDGIGNALDNVLMGNSNANVLIGGAGNDTYYYDHINDVAFDSSAANGGIDIVFSSVTATLDTWVENLILTGSGDLTGVGNNLANTIAGNSGNNLLAGMAGADILSGGGGNDTFVYHIAAHSTSIALDQILGFDLGDRIDLSLIDADTGTGADDAFTFIGAAAFSNTAGELRAYQSGSDWFVEGDVDGDGIADLMISLTTAGGHAILSSDFVA